MRQHTPASATKFARATDRNNEDLPISGNTMKPKNLSAYEIPKDGFALSVDGKLKMRYETAKEAMTAASNLKQSYPVVQVAVYDAAERVYMPVELQEKA